MPRIVVPLASLAVLAGCAGLSTGPALEARAELREANGRAAGTARFEQVGDSVHIVLTLTGLPPGPHAVHIHAVGRCDPPDFGSAGAHFNPERRQHGLQNPEGPHAGDLPNVTVQPDGQGRLETVTARVTLGSGPASLFDADGSALVVHAGPDDFKTDPAGQAGARIACGVITRVEPPRPAPVRGY
jgi:superoxide dismutase, Cu-Zn family